MSIKGNKILSIVICLVLIMAFTIRLAEPVAYARVASDRGYDVLVFMAGAIVGGASYDGVKWVLSEGVKLAVANPAAAATILAMLAVTGVILYSITLTSDGYVDYGTGNDGCRYSPDGRQLLCPYSKKNALEAL